MTRYQSTSKAWKRLIVLSDGTWQTPENDIPTNILKLAMSIRLEDDDGVQQIVHYDAGVGTQGAVDKIMGGGLGEGIDINIQELYTFLALNYDDGDEVYLFGFSRGSYTVRSLCGLIYESGLVRRDQLQFVREAYNLYRDNEDVESERAVAFREAHGDRIPITCLAAFDTVGSLGLPFEAPPFLGQFNASRYKFHSTKLNPSIVNAIHMLSIDEDRSVFSPTKMEVSDEERPGQLTQLFFWGGHGGIGGGDARQTVCSAITINFVVEEIERRGLAIAFDKSYLPDMPEDVDEEVEAPKSSALMGFVARLTGKFVRKVPSIDKVHPTVIRRYQSVENWRPAALGPLEEELLNAEV